VATWRWATQSATSTADKSIVAKPAVGLPSTLAAPRVQLQNGRLVYPYSVVPGGVVSGNELKDVAAQDPVVAEHYAGFDYKRARVIEVSQPKLV